MASCLDLDISCPVCLEVFKNPVVLSCSHSFCKACVQNWWTEKVTLECPVCKRRSSRSDPPCNLVLKNLCEAFSQELTLRDTSVQSEPLCPQHKEKLQLFCRDHQQPVCLVCRDSREHHNHRFSPIDEAVQEYKELLRQRLRPLQDRLEKCRKMWLRWERTSEHIKRQGQHTESMIKREFDKIRDFLQKEEQARIRALKTEVQQKISLMEQRVAALSQDISTFSDSIRQTENELKAQDVPFLQNYTAALGRVQQVPLSVTELPSGSLVDVAKHLGNLSFNIWNKMKELVSYTPVVLDPNTACSFLTVSDDLCSVKYETEENKYLPDNPERFMDYFTVLASEGFTSGVHSWEVDVHNEEGWAVGVTTESTPRRGLIDSGCWLLWFKNGDEYTAYAPPFVDKALRIRHPLQKIRVDLNLNGGKLSFYDPQREQHIYTFTHSFKERVFPYINTTNLKQIKIAPVEISVQLLYRNCVKTS